MKVHSAEIPEPSETLPFQPGVGQIIALHVSLTVPCIYSHARWTALPQAIRVCVVVSLVCCASLCLLIQKRKNQEPRTKTKKQTKAWWGSQPRDSARGVLTFEGLSQCPSGQRFVYAPVCSHDFVLTVRRQPNSPRRDNLANRAQKSDLRLPLQGK